MEYYHGEDMSKNFCVIGFNEVNNIKITTSVN